MLKKGGPSITSPPEKTAKSPFDLKRVKILLGDGQKKGRGKGGTKRFMGITGMRS